MRPLLPKLCTGLSPRVNRLCGTMRSFVDRKLVKLLYFNAFFRMVPGAGIEPARLAAGDFESPASTNFTTRARGSRTRPDDGCGRTKTAIICVLSKIVRRPHIQPLIRARSARPFSRKRTQPSSSTYFFSGKNQFITKAQIPPVATPDSSTLFTACGRCDRISGTCDTPSPRARDTAMINSARRSN